MSAADRPFILANTRSGGFDPVALRRAIEARFGDEGDGWSWALRTKGQSRRDLTRAALGKGHRVIVAAGGDGTVAKVADVVSQADDAVLGVLPTGTGNLFARELGVPLSIPGALERISADPSGGRRVDGMQVNGQRRCFSHVSLGTYSRIASLDTPAEKQALGRLAYLRHMARELRRETSWTFRLSHDGRPRTVRASLVLVANVGAVGLGGLRWGDDIAPDDGVLEVCIVHARDVPGYLRLAGRALLGQHRQAPEIEYLRVHRELVIVADDPDLPVRGDGKEIGRGRVAVRVLPGAVTVVNAG